MEESDENKIFLIPACLLTSNSPVFEAMLAPEKVREEDSRTIHLKHCDATTLDYFLIWLSDMDKEVVEARLVTRVREEDESLVMMQMVKLWCFGHQYSLPRLQNLAISLIVSEFLVEEQQDEMFQVAALEYAIERTSENSSLSDFLLLLAAEYVPRYYFRFPHLVEHINPTTVSLIMKKIAELTHDMAFQQDPDETNFFESEKFGNFDVEDFFVSDNNHSERCKAEAE